MYKKLSMSSRIRVPPKYFGSDVKKSIIKSIQEGYEGYLTPSQELLLCFIKVESVGDGVIIPGDGAIYYNCDFEMISYAPEIHEVVEGVVTEIAEFGAFAKIGPIEGLIHQSQVMDDYVTYSKSGTLLGRDTKRSLKIGDKIRARVIAANLKTLQTAKVGLTMRQPGLGTVKWLSEERAKAVKTVSKKKEAKS